MSVHNRPPGSSELVELKTSYDVKTSGLYGITALPVEQVGWPIGPTVGKVPSHV